VHCLKGDYAIKEEEIAQQRETGENTEYLPPCKPAAFQFTYEESL
jgi:hypothetical protein